MHQNVFFLTQHRISRSDPVVHPSPGGSSVSIGAVATPARPGSGILADTHPQCLGEGKRKSCTMSTIHLSGKDQECVFIPASEVLGGRAEGVRCPGGARSPSPPSAGISWGAPTCSCPPGLPSLLPQALSTHRMKWGQLQLQEKKGETYECSISQRTWFYKNQKERGCQIQIFIQYKI